MNATRSFVFPFALVISNSSSSLESGEQCPRLEFKNKVRFWMVEVVGKATCHDDDRQTTAPPCIFSSCLFLFLFEISLHRARRNIWYSCDDIYVVVIDAARERSVRYCPRSSKTRTKMETMQSNSFSAAFCSVPSR